MASTTPAAGDPIVKALQEYTTCVNKAAFWDDEYSGINITKM
jgi:hypothetical protein